MTPAETLAVYIALIGIPVFAVVLLIAMAHAAKRGDEQPELRIGVELEPQVPTNSKQPQNLEFRCRMRRHAILVGRMPNRGARR